MKNEEVWELVDKTTLWDLFHVDRYDNILEYKCRYGQEGYSYLLGYKAAKEEMFKELESSLPEHQKGQRWVVERGSVN